MTLAGKIITVLILLLSLVYMTIAVMVSAAHQNWQAKALKLKDQVEQLHNDKKIVLQQIEEKDKAIRVEKVARTRRIQTLESQVQQAAVEHKDLQDEFTTISIKAEESFKRLEQAENRLAIQDANVEDLNLQLKTKIDELATEHQKVIDLISRNNELDGQLRHAKRNEAAMAEENALWSKVGRAKGFDMTDLTSHIAPSLDGFVNEVGRDLIAVNLGSDDGLRPGHRLDLHRDGRFVGSAEVTHTDPNRSAARIDKELTKIAIEIGDRVTTDWDRAQK